MTCAIFESVCNRQSSKALELAAELSSWLKTCNNDLNEMYQIVLNKLWVNLFWDSPGDSQCVVFLKREAIPLTFSKRPLNTTTKLSRRTLALGTVSTSFEPAKDRS